MARMGATGALNERAGAEYAGALDVCTGALYAGALYAGALYVCTGAE